MGGSGGGDQKNLHIALFVIRQYEYKRQSWLLVFHRDLAHEGSGCNMTECVCTMQHKLYQLHSDHKLHIVILCLAGPPIGVSVFVHLTLSD